MSDVDLSALRTALNDWAYLIVHNNGAEGVYLFGSLVYRDGEQFTSLSDVDLVVKFGTGMNALERATWVKELFSRKEQLEITLLGLLQRRTVEPFASVIAVTQTEISLDVQKENQPSFYSSNIFIDLLHNTQMHGLPDAASSAPCDRLLAGSLSMTQKMRHQFLGVGANKRTVLQPFDGEDRVPKSVMRAAAMARRLADHSLGLGAEYDTRLGLNYLTGYLLDHEKDDQQLDTLHQLISERLGARGKGGPISPFNQLLLAEIVFDLAISAHTGGSATLTGSTPSISPELAPDSICKAIGITSPSLEPLPTHEEPDHADSAAAETKKNETEPPLPSLKSTTSLSFFWERFQQAFPGVREITWFEDTADAIDRLARLLQPPLMFSDAAPIWWWRDGNLDIQSFEEIEESVVLINHDEIKVRRIAAAPGNNYKRNFVYVEADAREPTNLYKADENWLKERIKRSGYAAEEYGLYAGAHAFSRSEFDDGGTYIDGKYVDTTRNSTLRVRYLTPYNFIIAPQDSPINNVDFDSALVRYMNRALTEDPKLVIEELSEEVAALPLRRFA